MSLQEGQFVWLSGEPFVFNLLVSNDGNRDCILLLDFRGDGGIIGIAWGTFSCTSSTTQFQGPPGNIKFRPICKQEQTTTSESLDIGN